MNLFKYDFLMIFSLKKKIVYYHNTETCLFKVLIKNCFDKLSVLQNVILILCYSYTVVFKHTPLSLHPQADVYGMSDFLTTTSLAVAVSLEF